MGQERSPRKRFLRVGALHATNAVAEPMLAIWWPLIQLQLALTPGGLTLLQLCLPGGLWLGAFAGTSMATRYGTRATLVAGSLGFFGALPFVVAVHVIVLAGFVLAIVGFANGIFDVVQNTQTSLLEDVKGRRHMLAFKALFSIVAFLAASVSGGVVELGVGPVASLLGTAVVALAIVLPVGLLLPDVRPEQPAPTVRAEAAVKRVKRATRELALLAALAALPLGVMYTQGALLFRELGASGGFLATGLAAFSLAQAVTQLTLWRFSDRTSPRRAAALGGWLALTGAVLVGLSVLGLAGWVLAAAGVFLLGVGLAGISPTAQSVAGQAFPGQRAAAVGAVTRLNHVGIAFAPAVVFAFALPFGHAAAVATVLAICPLAVALFARRVYRVTEH